MPTQLNIHPPPPALAPPPSPRLSAQEALAAGLASRVCADPLHEAESLARRIHASCPAAAAARAKAAVAAAGELPLPEGLRRERELFYSCFGPQQREGMAAFREKRPPRFR